MKGAAGDLERTIVEGLAQTRAYMDRCGAKAGYLIVFDPSPDRSWEEKIFRGDAPPGAGAAHHRLGECDAPPSGGVADQPISSDSAPSIHTSVPVMWRASSEARNATSLPI